MAVRDLADYRSTASWAPWEQYVPSWYGSLSNPSLGNGTIYGAFRRYGSVGHLRGVITMGSTTTYGSGMWYVTMPTGLSASGIITNGYQVGEAMLNDTGTAVYRGLCYAAPGGTVLNLQHGATTWTNVTATSPFTWVSGDFLAWNITVELDYQLP